MELFNLKPAEGATKREKRIGRGQGSGYGGTSTRGHKGAKSRSGYKTKRSFQGGQMPLQRLVPKFGFKNINRVEYKSINLNLLQRIADKDKLTKIDVQSLVNYGLIGKNDKVKVLGGGEIKVKLDIRAHAFSKNAKEKIEKLNGTIELI
jgi:large subunit ribosomal protein L15